MENPTLFGNPKKILNAIFGLIGAAICFFTYSKVHSLWPSVAAGVAVCVIVRLAFRSN